MIKKPKFWKGNAFFIVILFIGATLVPSIVGEKEFNFYSFDDNSKITSEKINFVNNETEYWGLIFAVGIYYRNPVENRPDMIKCAENLYEVLVSSPNWQKDNIHKVVAYEATGLRLIKELLWLIRNEDSDDMSFIYITSHGGPLMDQDGKPIDLPPKDEADGVDEVLIMHRGFDKWYAFIWDDLLNFFISKLESKGVCLIVDSCYAGGFNDEPMFSGTIFEKYDAESFAEGFTEEFETQGRVVLMSCRENEVSYLSGFSDFLIDGFSGQADIYGNTDGINSAEEAFGYVESRIWDAQHPTILDLYPGEYPVTYS